MSPSLQSVASFARSTPDAAPHAPRGEPARIRFTGLSVHRAPSGCCRATVTLERTDGQPVEGAADAEAGTAGDLRAAAMATIEALHRAAKSGERFTLLGVKHVRAFDRYVVLVQLGRVGLAAVRGPSGDGAPAQLVGSAFTDGDLMRATVLAVLNASNRVLWTPPPSDAPA
jgi:hypothetical protein